MKLLIHFLFFSISCLSIIVGGRSTVDKKKIQNWIDRELADIRLPHVRLQFFKDGLIYDDPYVMVWKGTWFNKTNVAIKIVANQTRFNREVDAYDAMEAGERDVVKHHIPNVYFYGDIIDEHFAIAMTLFEENLKARFKRQNKKINEPTILLIFKQTMEALSYMHEKNVYHCGLVMRSIFLKGNNAFIGDFNQAGQKHSSKIEDFSSLLKIMFELSKPKINLKKAILFESAKTFFEDQTAQGAILAIVEIYKRMKENTISGDYRTIIEILNNALNELKIKKFEWLK